MKASKAIIKCLEMEGTDVVFGYPGAAMISIYESLRSSKIKHILVRNEQSIVHYASGYARETGKVGVCLVTSGPGATNTITGIATAYLDSIPVVVITGQVDTDLIGTDAFQEADIKGATEPFTKHNYLVKDANDLPRILKEAFYIANSGRKGPVLIDIPKNIQEEKIKFDYEGKVDIRGYNPTLTGHMGQIKRAISRIKASKKPVIYAGGGIISANAQREILEFAEKTGIPVINSLMGIGGFPQDSRLYAGIVGSHGYDYSNEIIGKTDLLITIGARMSNRSTAGFHKLNPNIEFIHVDIDPAEIGKNRGFTLPIVGDAKIILTDLIDKSDEMDFSDWLDEIDKLKGKSESKEEVTKETENFVNPKEIIAYLSEKMDDDACLVADVGQNQIWSAMNFKVVKSRKFMTSGGLGTMAYSIPAAAGVKIGNPKRQVVCVIGDGGIQMCLGELAVIREQNADVKIILLNNGKLGLVREIQEDLYGKGHGSGVDLQYQVKFTKIAEAYNIEGYEVSDLKTFKNVLDKVLKSDQPCLIQCNIDPDTRTL
ncbi:biosynthetic-type acetolactate synthase large subunit [Alkalibacter mobilis]|uniref:biosynthetic-type acetolactate synthase large subunit n=1 Tax=Alkalibacter mobilis TaxID=2787712 RepID=UPI00189F687F|nr:biosynthetic-type acetolactate synthase large subunit [Alkalibacter mobilis]MBF7096895.1 biosynthetic-type acetolactate synthase large subunit [Alkalibacter mobilis]